MDVTEVDGEYIVTIEAPGVAKDDISIEFEDGVLTISGEKKVTSENEGEKSYRIERRYGAFTRSVRFADVEGDNIGASYDNGVLRVTVPKSEKAQPRKIAVE
jgi:HSP20 family protein